MSYESETRALRYCPVCGEIMIPGQEVHNCPSADCRCRRCGEVVEDKNNLTPMLKRKNKEPNTGTSEPNRNQWWRT